VAVRQRAAAQNGGGASIQHMTALGMCSLSQIKSRGNSKANAEAKVQRQNAKAKAHVHAHEYDSIALAGPAWFTRNWLDFSCCFSTNAT